MVVSEEKIEEEINIEKLRFLESPSIQYSYVIMFAIGGLFLIFGIIYSQLDLFSEAAGKIVYPISIIERLLTTIIYYGVILFLALNFVKISRWFKWKEPVPIANNITKILALFSSTSLFLMNIVYFIYYEVTYYRYIVKIDYGVGEWISFLRNESYYMLLVMVALLLLLAGSFIIGTILELIERRDIKGVNYRPIILIVAIAIVYTFIFYGTYIILRFDFMGNRNVGLLVYRLVQCALYCINGTIFILMSRK